MVISLILVLLGGRVPVTPKSHSLVACCLHEVFFDI